MVNKEDFTKRLEEFLAYYEITAAALASKLGVQRSSISHLLAGRNKPSLDFIIKILDNYPKVSFDWLVRGIGSISTETKSNRLKNNASNLFEARTTPTQKTDLKGEPDLFTNVNSDKSIEMIVFFYSDGSFKSYKP